MALFSFLGKLISPVTDIINKSVTDKDLRNQLLHEVSMMEMKLEAQLVKEQAETIRAEVAGKSWLQRNWRPICMLGFMVCVMAYWFGLTPDNFPPEAVDGMFGLIQIGMGGYVVGRSAEKIVPAVLNQKKQ